jgi:hypothetical protein
MPAHSDHAAPLKAWPDHLRLWYVAVTDRQTGRPLGRPEVYADSTSAAARMACLERETDTKRADVICWRG